MKEKLLKILGGVLGSLVFALVVFTPLVATALLGGGLMRAFGLRYDSVGQLIFYFAAATLIGLPLGQFSGGLPKVLHRMGLVSRRGGNLLYIPLDTLCSYFAFWLADLLLPGVSATGLAIWMISLVLAVVDLPLKKKATPPADG